MDADGRAVIERATPVAVRPRGARALTAAERADSAAVDAAYEIPRTAAAITAGGYKRVRWTGLGSGEGEGMGTGAGTGMDMRMDMGVWTPLRTSASCSRPSLTSSSPPLSPPIPGPVSAPPCLGPALSRPRPVAAPPCLGPALSRPRPVAAPPCLGPALTRPRPVSASPCLCTGGAAVPGRAAGGRGGGGGAACGADGGAVRRPGRHDLRQVRACARQLVRLSALCVLTRAWRGRRSYDVDEVAAEHADADLVVHYGPAALSATARLPVLFVFGQAAVDVADCAAAAVRLLLADGASGPPPSVLVMADLAYAHAVRTCPPPGPCACSGDVRP